MLGSVTGVAAVRQETVRLARYWVPSLNLAGSSTIKVIKVLAKASTRSPYTPDTALPPCMYNSDERFIRTQVLLIIWSALLLISWTSSP